MFESCLPLELGRHIVEVGNFTKKDFVVLSNVSRLFRNEAQRALFRDPGHFYLGAIKDSERTEAFFDAIISSPRRLALMVHTYSQDTRWYDYSWEECGPSCDHEQEVIFEKMTQAFKLMVNMKRFQSSDSAFNGYFYDGLLDSVMQAFPKLEAFSWYYEGGVQQIIDFLAHQDRIRYLDLPSEFDIGDHGQQERERLLLAAQTMCSKLETISAPIETTKVLLPGKSNIRYLRWTQQSHDKLKYEADVQRMLGELGNLRYLEYAKCYPESGIPFQIIAPHLRDLVFLRVCNKTVTRGTPAHFDHLLHLRAIDFFDDSFHATEIIPHDHLRRIFLGCKQLRYIDFERKETDDEGYYHSIFRRFTRSPGAEQIPCEILPTLRGQEVAWDNRVAMIDSLTTDSMLPASARCTST